MSLLRTLTDVQAQALFDCISNRINVRVDETGRYRWDCDHTLRHTKAWLQARGIHPITPVFEELKSKGGYCDCEVLLNVSLGDAPHPI